MPKPNFAPNLRAICDLQQSVAHVCRSMEINRQQFNKYLNGQIYPSKFNLARICKYFKLSEVQFTLPCADFNRLLDASTQSKEFGGDSIIGRVIESLPSSIEMLSRYQGFYYSYFHALGFPGCLLRSLVQIYRYEDRFYTRNIEHLWNKEKGEASHHRFKYRGIALYLADRIFITEYEMLAKNNICHTILFPSYRNAIDTLSGISTGVGSLNTHMPKSTRVVFKYLGKKINVREALKNCGLYDLDSESINDDIKQSINNEISADEYVLTARDQ